MGFILHRLSQHQDVQNRLRSELSNLPQPLQSDDIRKALYLNAVINETLRLHPPTLWTNRGMVMDTELIDSITGETLTLEAGTCAFIPIHAVHRSPLNWPHRPDDFLPERWLPDAKTGESPEHHPLAFVPFSGGRRMCPGFVLAQVLHVHCYFAVAVLKFYSDV